jgi:hypothetical protein
MNTMTRGAMICGLFVLGALSARGGTWPASPDPYPAGAKIAKPLYATIDITDDMWRSQSRFSRENMFGLMRYLAKLGVSRVYWLRTPEYLASDWLLPAEGNAEDAERIVVEAAHAAGLECFAIFKPFETGVLTMLLPHSHPVPKGVRTIEMQAGQVPDVASFLIDHPEFRIQRRPLPVDPHQTVKSIKLVKSDESATSLKKENLEIWTSRENGRFERWRGQFTLSEGVEQRLGKTVRVLTLSGLAIPADQRFLMVRAAGVTNPAAVPFANVPGRLMELFGENGIGLPSNNDDGIIPRQAITQSLQALCIRLYGSGALPPELALPPSYGTALETLSFWFGQAATVFYGASPPPLRTLESATGYIVAAKGKEMSMPAPHPGHPEVRAYWLDQMRAMLAHGFDGIDLRIDNHSTWLAEAGEYGFNEPVVAAYREKYGIDILKDQIDPARWRGIQGDSYTQFVREARALTREKQRPLHLHVSGVFADVTPGFDLNNLPKTIEWQWERWIAEDLCDGIHLKLLPWPWGSYRGKGQEFALRVIEMSHRHGKSVSADARIQKYRLISAGNGADPLTADDVNEVLDSLSWAWRSRAIDAMNLYEVFDFVQMDGATGKVYGSPAFEQILDAVRNGREDVLPKTGLRNWISRDAGSGR